MTIDLLKTRIKAHQRNLERYRQLLPMSVTTRDREFITGRIEEEKASIRQLKAELKDARVDRPLAGPSPDTAGTQKLDGLSRL